MAFDPDWQDAGTRLTTNHQGSVYRGTLYLEDIDFDGEGEVPFWVVECDDGIVRSFYDYDWRVDG